MKFVIGRPGGEDFDSNILNLIFLSALGESMLRRRISSIDPRMRLNVLRSNDSNLHEIMLNLAASCH